MLLVPDLFKSLKTGPEDFLHFFDKKDSLHVVVLRVKSSVLDPDMNPEPAFQLIRVLKCKCKEKYHIFKKNLLAVILPFNT